MDEIVLGRMALECGAMLVFVLACGGFMVLGRLIRYFTGGDC